LGGLAKTHENFKVLFPLNGKPSAEQWTEMEMLSFPGLQENSFILKILNKGKSNQKFDHMAA